MPFSRDLRNTIHYDNDDYIFAGLYVEPNKYGARKELEYFY
jgi:hypothetical protein